MTLHRELSRGFASNDPADPPASAAALLLVPEWTQALRLQQSLSLMVVTVDHVRAFSGQYGRELAEARLLHIGEVLKATAGRARDSVGRCSADAFMVLLPHTPADGARAVAERCQRAIRAAQVEPLLTASFGAGTLIPRSGAGHSVFFNTVAQLSEDATRAGGDRILTRHFAHSRTGAMRG
ncbi:diguanylate cyclase domain-containing protein [Pseudomonas sp.]|uniref:diguanylate cyclase domain-containing protein n=1 Tax=Pseudomonas sp. TaxID=306 RepID=UPI003CC5A251